VETDEEAATAAEHSISEKDVTRWEAGLEDLLGRAAHCFRSDEARAQAADYVAGLLSPAERKTSWALAELAGDSGPWKMQRLLSEYAWNADRVRDVVGSYVAENLFEPGGVLVVDETGFLKKGDLSAGVQRQYSGTAGRVENCQIGVFAAYVSGKGRAFVDRELYLPASWTDSRERCAQAGVPRRRGFATRPLLALDMIRRFWLSHQDLRWVAGDEVYGADPELRDWLEEHRVGYVLGIARDTTVATAIGRRRVDALAGLVPASAWETYSCADGAKGPGLYDWALVDTTEYAGPDNRAQQVLVRRSRTAKAELAFFLTHSPRPEPLSVLVMVAGRRWGVEECFQTGKNEVGLDHYQVRLYHGWYRHVTLAILAQAWLAVSASESRDENPPEPPPQATAVGYQRLSSGLPIIAPAEPDRPVMAPITSNEIRRIVNLFRPAVIPHALISRWSAWRRRHQARARHYHFRSRIRAAQGRNRLAAAT
jgi:SRSO17 transposase